MAGRFLHSVSSLACGIMLCGVALAALADPLTNSTTNSPAAGVDFRKAPVGSAQPVTGPLPVSPTPAPNTNMMPVASNGPNSTGLPKLPHPGPVVLPIILNAPDTTQGCLPGGVAMCNTTVPIQSQIPLGGTVQLSVPSPYKHQPFTVQCVSVAGVLSYQVVDQSEVTCAPQTCGPQAMSVCNNQVDVQGGTKVGDSLTVDIPASKLSDPVYGAQHFQATCTDTGDGDPLYKLGDVSGLHCNGFTCPDSVIRLCDANIPIQGGAKMGEVLQMTMPEPFMPDGLAVECLGTEGKPPAYQAVDVSNVTCERSP